MKNVQILVATSAWMLATSGLIWACPSPESPAARLAAGVRPRAYTVRDRIPAAAQQARAANISGEEVADAILCNFEDRAHWPRHDQTVEGDCQDGPGICSIVRAAPVLLYDVHNLAGKFAQAGLPVDTARFSRLYGQVARYFAEDFLRRCTASIPIREYGHGTLDDSLFKDACQGRRANPESRLGYLRDIIALARQADIAEQLGPQLSVQADSDARVYLKQFINEAEQRAESRIDFKVLREDLRKIGMLSILGDIPSAPYAATLRNRYRAILNSLVGGFDFD